MSRGFRFPSHRLQELINAPKCPASKTEVKWRDRGEKGKELRLTLELVDGPFAGFALHVTCGDVSEVTSYRAALILEGERVRGVDYSPIARTRFYKPYIEKGWHQNIIDPNLPLSKKEERNRHPLIEGFAPADLESFLREVCRLWHIDLDFGEALL